MRSRMIQVAVAACLCLGPAPTRADLGPIPKEVAVGDLSDPKQIKLLANHISIRLGRDRAMVRSCFRFLITRQLPSGATGPMGFAWPIPDRAPDPVDFEATVNQLSASSPEEAAQKGALDCSGRWGLPEMTSRAVSFSSLGISRWIALQHEMFLWGRQPAYMTPEIQVSYEQPYRRLGPSGGGREFIYVLRTGAQWAGPIEFLQVDVTAEPGVKIVRSNYRLRLGTYRATSVEPTEDLRIRISQ